LEGTAISAAAPKNSHRTIRGFEPARFAADGTRTGVSVMAHGNQSRIIEGWLQQLRAGDDKARTELLNCACERMTQLTRKMLKGYGRVKRWEQTDDVVQNALLRLYRSLAEMRPTSVVEFYRLAALNIRRELLDLAKHYYGPRGLGANYASIARASDESSAEPAADRPAADDDPGRLAAWTAFHANVEELPPEEKEVFDLLWYQELSQAEAANLLQVSDRTIKRRWAAARLRLHEALGGPLPEA
jgi:RNA polymerase sigma-70 factor (ECF subfamily)